MNMQEKTWQTNWLGRQLIFKTGKLAKQADACLLCQYGDTVVMATVVEAKTERGVNFFPLSVDFEERLYAAGIIKGSRWIKREGRPSDDSILTGRMIDRSIRPLFDDSSKKDIQVVLTVLSADGENDYDIVSLVAASAVLSISPIKWKGPIAGIRVAYIDQNFVFNPTYLEMEKSDLDLIIAGTEEKTLMIEAGAQEIKEDLMKEAILQGQKEMKSVIELIQKMQSDLGVVKNFDNFQNKQDELLDQDEIDKALEEKNAFDLAEKWLDENIKNILFNKDYYTKGERKLAIRKIKEALELYLKGENINNSLISLIINDLVMKRAEKEASLGIINEKRRVDGRALDEIRDLSAEVAILPRNHGSSLFSRGETQIMSIVTLGSSGMEQHLEGLEGVSTKNYMHHYNFPPYCVGETKPMRGPGRREVGHGALAEKAILPVLPSKEEFPYTIRVVSETLGSNGSSSMGSTCASSLALMHAGVPIKKAVAGIAMGLASLPDMSHFEVITDLQDLEDGKGGMDFKITGTKDGLTAIQLDTKTEGITPEIVEQALSQGRKALNEVLDVMNQSISECNKDLSPYAPRIISFRIDSEKIRDVIGPGGKIINEIIDAHDVSIDIEDDGLVMVCGKDQVESEKAVAWIKNIVKEVEAGETFTGTVTRILDFGAFVEVLPGKEGLVHVSEMAPYRVGKPQDLVKIGDKVTVKVKEIDDKNRINLTMKDLMENKKLWLDKKDQARVEQKSMKMKSRFSKMSGERIFIDKNDKHKGNL